MNIMQLTRSDVEDIAYERGYETHEIQGCFIRHVNGDLWEVDVDHKEYPRECSSRTPRLPRAMVLSGGATELLSAFSLAHAAKGAGTELKKLLGRFGLATAPGCACNARAAEMDRNGIDWCEQNESIIIGWLREQANARGLPFLDAAGRLLVRRAIRNARKASA